MPTAIMATPIGTRSAIRRKRTAKPVPPMARSLMTLRSAAGRRARRFAASHGSQVSDQGVEDSKDQDDHAEDVERNRPPAVERESGDLFGGLAHLHGAVEQPPGEHQGGG